MKHFSKKLLSSALLATTLLASSAYAGQDNRAVVVDKEGRPLHSIVSGECVRTKWESNTDACGTAAPTPAPVAAAPVEREKAGTMHEQKRSYLVFFDFDKSVLNDDSKSVINSMLEKNKSDGAVTFAVTGHADRSGSDAYNLKLSEKRANAVKAELIAAGVPENAIQIDYKGESEPLVQTDDGIKEPQNRRAEIRVSTEVMEKN